MKDLKDMLNESRGDIDKDIKKKAKEIADNNEFPALYSKLYAYECVRERESAALEMADWMKSYMIEKACKWLRANVDNYARYNVKTDECFVDDFEDDFVKAMEK